MLVAHSLTHSFTHSLTHSLLTSQAPNSDLHAFKGTMRPVTETQAVSQSGSSLMRPAHYRLERENKTLSCDMSQVCECLRVRERERVCVCVCVCVTESVSCELPPHSSLCLSVRLRSYSSGDVPSRTQHGFGAWPSTRAGSQKLW